VLLTGVLISPQFPFHIFSEILALENGCTATKSRALWTFNDPRGGHALSAVQRVAETKLYFIVDGPNQGRRPVITGPDRGQILAFEPALGKRVNLNAETNTAKVTTYSDINAEITALHAAITEVPETIEEEVGEDERIAMAPTMSKAKNLARLVELHLAHSHWNFPAIAAQYNLTLPVPTPLCWACLVAKPRYISHDKLSSRVCTRVSEGLAADAKGPMNTPTPEGYLYYFVIVCLYST
jgi:hypothetical protein